MIAIDSLKKFVCAGFAILALGACSPSNQDTSTGTVRTYTGYPQIGNTQSCNAGSVLHPTYGCIQQSGCPVGSGLYGNQCVAVGNSFNSGQCPAGYVYSVSGCVVSPAASACQGMCTAGQVQTAYGCLPQNTMKCGNSCYGFYNGYCIGQSGDYVQVGY
jgi:hypothetical protein